MAFIFSTSHLPETRVRRPDDIEEEDEEYTPQPMPRAGGVRAFSHLPQPARSQADFTDASRDISPRREIAQIPPRSATPAPPKPEDQDDPSSPEADTYHDDAPEADTGPHEPDDSRPWYMPRLSPNDLAQAHGEEGPRSGMNRPGVEAWKEPTRDSRFTPSPQNLRDSPSNPAPGTSTKDDPAQDNRPALAYGRLFERRMTPGLRDQTAGQFQRFADKAKYHDLAYHPKTSPEDEQDQRPVLFQNVTSTKGATIQQGLRLGASQQATAQNHAGVQQTPESTAGPQVSRTSAEGSALQEHNRIQALDPSDPIEPRQRIDGTSLKNKSPEQFAREKAAYLKAKAAAAANRKFNYDNQQTLKAWQNYDRAIQMMDKTPEGHKVLEHLRNEKNRVFKVVMLNDPARQNYMGKKLSEGAQAQHIDTGKKDEQGREIHVIFLSKTALEGNVLKPNGEINPDAEALEKIWHELYHASERHTSGGVDPLGLGTTSIRDRIFPLAHERRAVRFENIIRFRNGGTRIKDKYGGQWVRGDDGQMHIRGVIEVPDALPPKPSLPSK